MHMSGIHHVTAIAGSASRNLDFYSRTLGLRFVQYVAWDGQSCWFLALFWLGFSSLMGAVNYLTTIIKLRCPDMTMFAAASYL